MDFAQPVSMQYAGQIASYLSAVPATVVTMFGIIVQFYHSKIKWGIIPLMFLIGVAGWAIGGFAAVVDSTIAINKVLHNTLWVPAHFHTYMLLGIVLFIFAFLFYLFSGTGNQDGGTLAKTGFWIFVAGGHGFLATFYLGGMYSIPRRFSDYAGIEIESVHKTGALLAEISVWLISLLIIGLLIMYISLFAKLLKRKTSPPIG
jgi:cytochrome c oxidase subunit 1